MAEAAGLNPWIAWCADPNMVTRLDHGSMTIRCTTSYKGEQTLFKEDLTVKCKAGLHCSFSPTAAVPFNTSADVLGSSYRASEFVNECTTNPVTTVTDGLVVLNELQVL